MTIRDVGGMDLTASSASDITGSTPGSTQLFYACTLTVDNARPQAVPVEREPADDIRELIGAVPDYRRAYREESGKLSELIEYHNTTVSVLEQAVPNSNGRAAIEQYRDQIDARKAENYGFASMAAVPLDECNPTVEVRLRVECYVVV
ncbi:hypothetical protein PILCRDRAFT_14996 [Piloderma croceum F 1598]|uniref:Uncharacterized protein n=1 Tax=Piloderma croceum (strain F 1598) TaxID=765440 RepID=A0A0C3B8R0_PILCF|nr:hypothetical protein PILCRDRAFT_14996 [Piloderma croceum F 1598]